MENIISPSFDSIRFISAGTGFVFQGRNIRRFREMRSLKQEGLAIELGEDWSQKKISLLESKEEIDPETLKQVADVLKVPVEAITNMDEDGAINIIATTFNSHDNSFGYKCSFYINPVDKWMEANNDLRSFPTAG